MQYCGVVGRNHPYFIEARNTAKSSWPKQQILSNMNMIQGITRSYIVNIKWITLYTEKYSGGRSQKTNPNYFLICKTIITNKFFMNPQ